MKFESYIAIICIFYIVAYKFYYRQKICLVILLLIHKQLLVYCYSAILSLGMTIYLSIKGYRWLLFDIMKIIQQKLKLWVEQKAWIIYDRF